MRGERTVRGTSCVVLLDGGAGAGAVARVRALVHRPLEEVVLQRVVRRDARLRVVVEHAHDEI